MGGASVAAPREVTIPVDSAGILIFRAVRVRVTHRLHHSKDILWCSPCACYTFGRNSKLMHQPFGRGAYDSSGLVRLRRLQDGFMPDMTMGIPGSSQSWVCAHRDHSIVNWQC